MSENSMRNYGFPLPDHIEESLWLDVNGNYSKICKRREDRWKQMKMKENQRSRKLKRFVRKGIPRNLRGQLWMELSGARYHMQQNPGLYQSLLTNQIDSGIASVINADLPRTFPHNSQFQLAEDQPNDLVSKGKFKQLGNVLRAFASHNPSVGYCQGLNYVAAFILLVLTNEEEAFWLFQTLIGQYLQSYYSVKMKPLQIDCLVLQELLKRKLPKVHTKMKDMSTNCIVLCAPWFICTYVDILPIETVMRIFDCLFYEGDKVLFRVGLTLFKLMAPQLQQVQTFPEFFKTFKTTLQSEHLLQSHSFLQNCFKSPDPLPYRLLKKLRKSLAHNVESNIFY